MQENEITQIRVKGNLVGITGLQKAMADMSAAYSRQTDEAIGRELIKRLSGRNYMPESAKNAYAQAFAHEFRKYLGQPVEEESSTVLTVVILGPGCANCNRLETDVRNVLAEINAPAEMIHVTDALEISKYGLMGLPALVINKKVVSVGTAPDKKKIKQWMEEAIRQLKSRIS
jgi:hypothetical protein